MEHSNIIDYISKGLSISQNQVHKTLRLLNEGATIPFIARYRKEQTGSLDEVEIQNIEAEFKKITELTQRKDFILQAIGEQGKLTPSLKEKIINCFNPNVLEDLYLPYKKKRRTKADKAREQGLQGLADFIFEEREGETEKEAIKYLNEEIAESQLAIQGAMDIVAETLNEDEDVRKLIRSVFSRTGFIQAEVIENKRNEAEKYKVYFDYSEKIDKAPSHRVLAVFRGEAEELLRVKIRPEEEETVLEKLERKFLRYNRSSSSYLKKSISNAYKRLLAPSIENEFRKLIREKADDDAISVFAQNLEQLLLQAPLGGKTLLALDPGFRTGCKLVVLNGNGDLLYHSTVYPHEPQRQKEASTKTIYNLIEKYKIEVLATGNGTAGKETYDWLNKEFSQSMDVYMVNESGASVYSASDIAREEFPGEDLTVRGTVSIGRRLIDPLSELVKIDPKSIGVGQYQHDVNQVKLKDSLENKIIYCVNKVGVQLNTAGKKLLSFVSGIGSVLAENLVEHRKLNGPFTSRKDLLKVTGMGPKTFELCAGFLKVQESENQLDNTSVHPESYRIVQKMAEDLNITVENLIQSHELRKTIRLNDYISEKAGMPTLTDIMKELEKPGLDPRGKAEPVKFSNTINYITDLHVGMTLPGIVNNITNFGAFVDIGIKEGGLLHISQISQTFIKHPSEKLHLQQELNVKIIEIDIERKRISLSLL